MEDLVRSKGYLALGTRFRRIGEKLQAQTQSVMAAHGLNLQANHYPVLAALSDNGPSTVGNIAIALGVSQPGVTRLVGQLVKLGAVGVEVGQDDQRQKIVSLTESGEKLVEIGRETIWPEIQAALSEILDAQTGPILEQLDRLEDELQRQTFLGMVREKKGGPASGEV